MYGKINLTSMNVAARVYIVQPVSKVNTRILTVRALTAVTQSILCSSPCCVHSSQPLPGALVSEDRPKGKASVGAHTPLLPRHHFQY